MNKYCSIVFFSLIFLFTACGVVELDTPPPPDNGGMPDPSGTVTGPNSLPADEATFVNFLTGDSTKVWQAVQFTLEGLNGFQNCRLDDQMTLSTDGSYVFNGGVQNCGGEDQAQAAGSWSLDFNNAQLSFVLDGENFQGEVTGLTEDQIVITGTYLGLEVEARYESF